MAETLEHGLHDQEWPALAKAANDLFSLGLSPYNDPKDVLVAVLAAVGEDAKNTETLDSLVVKLLAHVS